MQNTESHHFNVASFIYTELFFFPGAEVMLAADRLKGQSVVSCNPAIWALPALGTTDGVPVYTAHTATAFIQHADMQHWKFPLYRDHIAG